jgi:Spy/CpxP family protein refolding chaperone
MRYLKALIAALGFAAIAASAQPPGPHGHGPYGEAGNIDRLAVLLDLDAYQKSQVEGILGQQRAAMQSERKTTESSGTRPSFEEMRAKREALHEDTLTKLKGVLTDQQIEKYKLLTEPQGGPRGPRGGPPPAAGKDAGNDVPH